MTGFGNSAMGTSPFGVGTPITSAEPPTALVRAGLARPGCRYLDPRTRDYVHDDNTRQLAQMPPVRQRVLLALLTLKGSSTVLPRMGVAMPRKISESFDTEVRHAVLAALYQLTTVERVARVNAIRAERLSPAGRVLVEVEFTDLTNDEDDRVTAAL